MQEQKDEKDIKADKSEIAVFMQTILRACIETRLADMRKATKNRFDIWKFCVDPSPFGLKISK